MKIIHNPHRWHLAFSCQDCQAELEADNNDIKLNGTLFPYLEFYLACPICGCRKILDESKLPEKTKRKLEREI